MKNRIALTAVFVALTVALSSCAATTSNTANTANTANSNAGAANSNAAKSSSSPKPTTPVKDEKKPEGQTSKGVPAAKKVPVPADWVYVYDDRKGYGFEVPAGTTAENETVGGVDSFEAWTPEPSEVWVLVMAWKDKEVNKDDLLKGAIAAMKEYGETVTAGPLDNFSDDYGLADATSVGQDGKKWKSKILVATDVTDNYVMIVSAEEGKFEANKSIIDAIWGSFEMWSSGASGNN